MKRILLISCVVFSTCILSLRTYAQYDVGDKFLNVGLGLNSYYAGGNPFTTSFEVMVNRDISVGGGLDYLSYHWGTPSNNYGFSALYLGARGSYHFNRILEINRRSNWDIYGGASLGFVSFRWTDNRPTTAPGSYGSGLFLGLHAGARYFFSSRVGAFFELAAFGASNARLGFAFKF